MRSLKIMIGREFDTADCPTIHSIMSIIAHWPMKNSVIVASVVVHVLMLMDLNINIIQTNISVQYSCGMTIWFLRRTTVLATVNLAIMWTVLSVFKTLITKEQWFKVVKVLLLEHRVVLLMMNIWQFLQYVAVIVITVKPWIHGYTLNIRRCCFFHCNTSNFSVLSNTAGNNC